MEKSVSSANSVFSIDAPYFCASGVFDENSSVIRAAPIIKYMIGWTSNKVLKYCEDKKWKLINNEY